MSYLKIKTELETTWNKKQSNNIKGKCLKIEQGISEFRQYQDIYHICNYIPKWIGKNVEKKK